MKQVHLPRIAWTSPALLLLVLAVAMMVINLTLVFKISTSDRQITSVLFWAAAASLIWERHQKLTFETGWGASLLGGGLLALLLLKSNGYCEESFLIAFPFIAAIALAMLAAGFKGLRVYWREIVLLFFVGTPEVIWSQLNDPSPLTARFASSLLWFSGHPVTQKGIYLHMPGGTVQVYSGCSGVVAMTQLLGMSVLFLMLLPLPWHRWQKLILPVAAIAIGFIVNSLRVALMAILVAQNQMAAFEYWHAGSGSLVFSVISTGLLLLLLWLLIQIFDRPQEREEPES